ncbi:MAG: hypothetical protein AAB628_01650 [Patescibacteria group bacterium]
MDGIKRKLNQDLPTPKSEIARRPSYAPELRPDLLPSDTSERISKNPFFEKSDHVNETFRVKPERNNPLLLWGLAVISLVVLGLILVTSYFSSATIEIVPVTQKIEIDQEFTAVKDPEENQLAFYSMVLNEEKAKEIPATIEKKIQEKASGRVIIFNTYSKDPQRLIKNTRLEATGGKIFRINDSVVVPGTKMVNGKMEPGQIEAVAYADAAGKEYNLGVVDFTIPGFKGDPRYTKFFARSVESSPLSGGFSGSVKVPSDEDISKAQQELKEDLKKSSIEKAQAKIPEGVTFFPGSVVLKYEEVPQDPSQEERKNVIVKSTLLVFFFDTASLTNKMAKEVLKEDKNAAQTISNMSSLVFSFVDPVDNIILSDLSAIKFRIAGNIVFVGDINKEKLVKDLAGKNNNEFSSVIEQQANIRKANGEIFPMWNSSFPKDPADISVKIINE